MTDWNADLREREASDENREFWDLIKEAQWPEHVANPTDEWEKRMNGRTFGTPVQHGPANVTAMLAAEETE